MSTLLPGTLTSTLSYTYLFAENLVTNLPLQRRPAHSGKVALTYTASIVVALAAWQAHRPDLIRSPKRVLAHLWEDSEL